MGGGPLPLPPSLARACRCNRVRVRAAMLFLYLCRRAQALSPFLSPSLSLPSFLSPRSHFPPPGALHPPISTNFYCLGQIEATRAARWGGGGEEEKDQGDADSNLEPFVKLLFPRPLPFRERKREVDRAGDGGLFAFHFLGIFFLLARLYGTFAFCTLHHFYLSMFTLFIGIYEPIAFFELILLPRHFNYLRRTRTTLRLFTQPARIICLPIFFSR